MSYADDIARITQLVLHERQGRDRGWWDQLADSFYPDGKVRISWFQGTGREFAVRSKGMSDSGNKALHRLCPPIIHLQGDRAFVEISGAIEFRIDVNGIPADLCSFTRLYFKVERTDGLWRVKLFTAVYERDTLMPSIPGQVITVDVDEIKKYRTAYAMISWFLNSKGFPIKNDLLGDDRPEEVDKFYAGLWSWLNTGVDSYERELES